MSRIIDIENQNDGVGETRGVSRAAEPPPPILSKKFQPPPPLTESFEKFSSRRRRRCRIKILTSSSAAAAVLKIEIPSLSIFLAVKVNFYNFSYLISKELILNYHSLFFCSKISQTKKFSKTFSRVLDNDAER